MSLIDNISDIWFNILKNIKDKPYYLEKNYMDVFRKLYEITSFSVEVAYSEFFQEYSKEIITLEDKIYKMKSAGYADAIETLILITIITAKDKELNTFILIDSSNIGILLKIIINNFDRKESKVLNEYLKFPKCEKYLNENKKEIISKIDDYILKLISNELLNDITEYENNYIDDKESMDYIKDLKVAFENLKIHSTISYVVIGKYYTFQGSKFEFSYNKAVKWYYMAVALESKAGYLYLSRCFYWGYGVPKNLKIAFEFCKKAAELGDSEAQGDLGSHYFFGNGIKADAEQGIYWYKKAAMAGNRRAMENLSIAYNDGIGVEINYEEALKWLEKLNNQK